MFVELKDGNRIYAKNVSTRSFGKGVVADKTNYSFDELNAFQTAYSSPLGLDVRFYKIFGKRQLLAVILGEKICVYLDNTYTSDLKSTVGQYKYQKKGGELSNLDTVEDLAKAIGDCKATKEVNNMDKNDIKSEFKENSSFLIELFERYNKSCN